jgi:alpha/beta superfamily hydrolase
MKKNVIILLVVLNSMISFSQSINGKWNGILEAGGAKLTLAFNIDGGNAKYTATMDSPDQGAMGIPCDSASFDGKNLTLVISKMKITYTGILEKKANEMAGTFSQSGHEFPLTLSKNKVEKKPLNRPQTPKEPFPYYSEDVTFQNVKDTVTLAGTLTLPDTKGTYPVVIMITGSGPQDRNEEIFEHKPFMVIADYLTKKGIGVLRFDDRGIGKSTGNFKKGTSADFANDVIAAVNYLKTRKEVQKKKIGLIGHSEGGMIAPMVATNCKDIAFIVLMAGPGISIDKLLILQSEKAAQLGGLDTATIKMNSQLQAGMYKIIKSNSEKDLHPELERYLKTEFAKLPATMKPSTDEELDKIIQSQIKTVTSPWFEYFVRFEPQNYLSEVTCPVLALNGSLDSQVPSKENLAGIENALKKGKNKSYKTVELPGLNHLFQEAGTGAFEEYSKIEQTISPKLLDEMYSWIKETVK